MSRDNKTLVSLGMSCQTIHQLHRLAGNDSSSAAPRITTLSGPFDWLICPPQSTVNLLNKKLPNFTKECISIKKGRAYWQDFNLYLWHSFLVGDGEKRSVNIEEKFEYELSRWQYLSRRFSTVDPRQTIFVLSNTQNNLQYEVFSEKEEDQYHFTPALLEELHHSLSAFFNTTTDNIHLEVITSRERMHHVESSTHGYLLPKDSNAWKGSNESWDSWWHQLLSRCR